MASTEKKVSMLIQSKFDDKGTKAAEKSVKGLGALSKSAIANVLSLAKAVMKITDNTDDLVASQRLLGTTFGSTVKEADKFTTRVSRIAGISEQVLNSEIALLGRTGQSLGMSTKLSNEYARSVSALSAKLSMLYNVDYEKMTDSLRAAAKGATKTFTELTGIVVKEQTLNQTLASMGVSRLASQLNANEVAMVQYIQIAKQVEKQDGNLSDIVNDVAYQKKMLSQQIQRLATAFGQMLYPILQKILPVFNAILIVITTLIQTIAKLLGYNGKSAESVEQVSNSYSGLGDNIDKAAKAAKKSLRGFDKLNNIQSPTSTSTGVTGGGVSIDPKIMSEFERLQENLDGIRNRAQEIADEILKWLGFTKDENGELKWSKEQFFGNCLKFLQKAWKWIAAIAGVIAGIALIKKIKDLIKNGKEAKDVMDKGAVANKLFGEAAKKAATALEILAVGIAGFALLAGVAMVLESFTNYLKIINEIGMSAGDVITYLGAALVPLVATLGILIPLLNTMSWESIVAGIVILGGLVAVILSINELLKTFAKLGDNASQVFTGFGVVVGSVIALMTAMAVIAKILSSDPKMLIGLAAITAAIVATLLVMEKTLPTILNAIGDFITKIAPSLNKTLEIIFNGIDRIVKTLGEILPPIIREIGKLFDHVFNGIAKVVRTVGDVIIGIMNTAKRLITDVLEAIIKFINDLGPAINNFVDNVISAVTKLINFIISAIEYLVNTLMVPAVKKIIEAVNLIPGVDIDVPKKMQIERFKPQLYADGGFPTVGELAIVNEKGPELLGNMNGKPTVANNQQIEKGIEQAAYQGFMRAINSSGGFNNNTQIVAEGDAEGLMNFIQFKTKEKNRQFGLD